MPVTNKLLIILIYIQFTYHFDVVLRIKKIKEINLTHQHTSTRN